MLKKKKNINEDTISVTVAAKAASIPNCPECAVGTLAFEEGCQKCYSCGYSKC